MMTTKAIVVAVTMTEMIAVMTEMIAVMTEMIAVMTEMIAVMTEMMEVVEHSHPQVNSQYFTFLFFR
jgi:hypothetical protein